MNANEYKLNWPNQIVKGDKLVAVKRGRHWVIRAEEKPAVQPPWASGPVGVQRAPTKPSGQDLLGDYTTKRAANKVIAAMNAARGAEKEEP